MAGKQFSSLRLPYNANGYYFFWLWNNGGLHHTRVLLRSRQESNEGWCQRQELNLRPKAYESSALPLSYAGKKPIKSMTLRGFLD
jgi:hypothetical protein